MTKAHLTIYFLPLFITLNGCTVRGVDTSLVPLLQQNGQVIYRYSDIAGLSLPDGDAEAEKLRLKDLDSWVSESGICKNGYEILYRQAILLRAGSPGKKIYYFIKCNK